LDFFDEEDEPRGSGEPRRRARRSATPREDPAFTGGPVHRPDRQQIMTRRLMGLVGAVVILILLGLVVRGCLDARKERAYQNYVRDLSSLTAETDQLSSGFFDAFEGSGDSDISLTNQINADRGTSQGLLERARNLDAPDNVEAAQAQITLAFELRHDAIETVAEQLPTALGRQGSNRAIRGIADQMEVLLASDVLYRRAREDIEQVVNDEGIAVPEGVPESEFLPSGNNAPDYLDPATVEAAITGAGGGGGGSGTGEGGADCDPGDDEVHGMGLVSTTLVPAGVALEPGATVTAAADGAEFEVSVQNQGTADESDVQVSLSGDFSGNQTIGSIAAGETETVTIAPRPSPSAGEPAEVTVTVDPVCGEQEETNNEASYTVSFE
jgi:hypothetical protein